MNKIVIKLLSDLCTSNGEVYNSSIDTDVCYDDYGLPYIPARRIKGCLREVGLELLDWKLIEKENYYKIFGKVGEIEGNLKISNAKIKNYIDFVSDIKNEKNKELLHQQNVLNNFTYLRVQTKINESGVAEKTSLRTSRVIKRGVEFESYIEIDKSLEDDLKKILKAFKRMGMSRTRGFGEIEATFEECIDTSKKNNKKTKKENEDFLEIINKLSIDEKYKVMYKITLDSPAIFKSLVGGYTVTEEFISGSKVLGIVASKLSKEKFNELMNEAPIFSNAYISCNDKRYTKVPASLVKIKDSKFQNGKLKALNMLAYKNKDNNQIVQTSSIGNYYINENNEILSVETEINYHHRRSEDKSKGRAEGNNFYQLSSIKENQEFVGFIEGTGKQIKTILKKLRNKSRIRLGSSKTAEYGNAVFSIIGDPEKIKKEKMLCKKFVLKLNSPTIIYNEFGMASTLIVDLEKEIAKKLGANLNSIKVVKSFLKYTSIGGYNFTWNMPKPVLNVFDLGTIVVIESEDYVDISKLNEEFIGVRINEGYGEVNVLNYNELNSEIVLKKKNEDEPKYKPKNELNEKYKATYLVEEIAKREILKEAEKKGREKAIELLKEKKLNATTIGKVTLICKEQDSYEGLINVINSVKSNDKKSKLLQFTKVNLNNLIDEKYKKMVSENMDNIIYKAYFKGLLNQAKYILRSKKGGKFRNE